MINEAYNLAIEQWIPCRLTNGKVQNLGLRDVLVKADEIEEIYDSSPLVTISLLRLILALLYGCYAAQTDEEFDEKWKHLWHLKKFSSSEIETYFDQWQDRFYLFHEEFPFYQTPCMSVVKDEAVKGEKDSKTIASNPDSIFRLHKDTPDVSISQLFDHRHLNENEIVVPAAEAARLLIATQNYGTSSSQSGRYTLDGTTKLDPGGRQNGLLFKGIVCWLTGSTLMETLLLNWIRPVDMTKIGSPCWESENYTKQITSSQKKGNAQIPNGLLDILTWQARMVRLIPMPINGDYYVSQVHFTQGRQAQKTVIRDPMKFYLRGSKGEEENVLCMTEGKASWREIHALLQFKQLRQNDTRPRVLTQIAERISEGDIKSEDLPPLLLNISGFINNQAKLILWRHERLSVPIAYLTDPELIEYLGSLMGEAEKVEVALHKATKNLCINFLAPGLNNSEGNQIEGAKKPYPASVSELVKCLNPVSAYWRMLEMDFNILIVNLLEADRENAANIWKQTIQIRAKQAFAEAITKLGDTPQVFKAAFLSQADFRAPSNKPTDAKSTSKGKMK